MNPLPETSNINHLLPSQSEEANRASSSKGGEIRNHRVTATFEIPEAASFFARMCQYARAIAARFSEKVSNFASSSVKALRAVFKKENGTDRSYVYNTGQEILGLKSKKEPDMEGLLEPDMEDLLEPDNSEHKETITSKIAQYAKSAESYQEISKNKDGHIEV